MCGVKFESFFTTRHYLLSRNSQFSSSLFPGIRSESVMFADKYLILFSPDGVTDRFIMMRVLNMFLKLAVKIS